MPTEFILPPPPWEGIVLNIPQRRLYYFPRPKAKEQATVITFPLGIARPGWPTPLGTTRITGKHKDPSWFVPKSIQEEHRRQGEPDFPEYFRPAPTTPWACSPCKPDLREFSFTAPTAPGEWACA